MAMAHHAPFEGYKRHYGVTDTAIRVFRERNEALTRTAYRTDRDLACVLDEWTWDSWQSGKYENIVDAGKPSVLVDLRGRCDDMYCIIRDNNRPERNGPPKTIITILDHATVEKNKATGIWVDHATAPGKPMTKLADKLSGKIIEMVSKAEVPANVPTPAETARPAPVPTAAPASQSVVAVDLTPETHKVQWIEVDDSDIEHSKEHEFVSKAAALDFASKLVNDKEVDPLDIQILKLVLVPTWVEVKRRVRFEVE